MTDTDLFSQPLSYARLEELCRALATAHPFLRVCTLAHSLCGRRIPYLVFGEGSKVILYVAGHHATEWICGLPLLAFADEWCRETSEKRPGESFRFIVIPNLNPDGTELSLFGSDPAHVLHRRQIRMNGGSGDFTHWQANARGVDLNHNYSVGFCEYRALEAERGIFGGAPGLYSGTYPESEPETAALANLIRMLRPALILTLHSQGEEIYFDAPHATPAMRKVAGELSSLTGYRLGTAEGTAAYGGLTEWAVRCGIPCYTLECGKGQNPLPLSDAPGLWKTLRPALFGAPFLTAV